VTAGELEEEPAIEPPGSTKVGVFDLGFMAQAGAAGSGLEAFLATQRRLAFEQQGEPVAVLQGAGFGLCVEIRKALGHNVETELGEHG
ncbi:hypothetical protein, partial [Limnospira sp. PMC 1252.20]|uniref:hypothetical protein n=1 Tax=Limnospira sp. PMC 1252.20 TaxID=2981050 RepID=UPI0028E11F62